MTQILCCCVYVCVCLCCTPVTKGNTRGKTERNVMHHVITKRISLKECRIDDNMPFPRTTVIFEIIIMYNNKGLCMPSQKKYSKWCL